MPWLHAALETLPAVSRVEVNDKLAEVAGCLHVKVGCRCLFEAELFVDHRAYLVSGDEVVEPLKVFDRSDGYSVDGGVLGLKRQKVGL